MIGRAELFVDTSGWFPLVEPLDGSHESTAAELRAQLESGARVVTTNLVIAETHALLLRRSHRAAALAFLREVRRSPNIVVTSDAELEERAQRDWLERFADHRFSLTDAVSFAVMSERGIQNALTTDHHFTIAGFLRVPR